MATRKRTTRSSSRKSRSGKMALKIAIIAGGAGFAVSMLVGVIVVGKLGGHVEGKGAQDIVSQTHLVSFFMALVAGVAVGGTTFGVASGVASRLVDLSLAVSKMGRGTPTHVRVSGNDEIAVLGRALSALANDMAGQGAEEEKGGGAAVDFDPKVRELRDKALPDGLEGIQGFEVDAALSAGSRGGTEYFDGKAVDDSAFLFLVGVQGSSAAATVAARMARDELLRAIGAGGSARKALAHTNRVLHRHLPRGVCAMATVLEISDDTVKVYQAGSRVPVLLCSAGELEDLTGEGLALGLDSGPVFEKGLRSNAIEMSPGMRIVVVNDAGNRNEDFVASIQNHSPKHTAAFMNMVLGELEQDAGAGGLREDIVLMTVKRA
jgi:Stage II sporulation protein E (SpoIIE)